MARTTLIAAVALGLLALTAACNPPNCDNVDYGTCGNACCNLTFAIPMSPEDVREVMLKTLSNGGPDNSYKLSMTAEGTLGFADLRQYNIGIEFLGQSIHTTTVMHYNDTQNWGLYRVMPGNTTLMTAFSISQIAGAYGDAGQNYKNLVTVAIGAGFPYKQQIVNGCPAPAAAPAVEAAPKPDNLHASCHLTWSFGYNCGTVSAGLAAAANNMSGFANCNGSEKCGYSVLSANRTTLLATHTTPVKHYVDDISISFMQASGTCVVDAFSSSSLWYAILDDGTNYCNLHNLAQASGLGFSETIDKNDCTQWQTANCAVY